MMKVTLLPAVAAVALCLALTGVAFAHAKPTTVSPGDGAVLSTAPTQVTMDTGEKMTTNPGDNTLIVVDAGGTQVTTVAATVDPTTQSTMTVPLPAGLAVGTYTVKWATVSGDDGEAASGSWSFTYDPSKPATPGRTDLAASTTTPPATPTAAPAAGTATATPTATAVAAQPAATGMAGLAASRPTGAATVALLLAAATALVLGARRLAARRPTDGSGHR
jgi:methionine-rich copper-binding protein CopC